MGPTKSAGGRKISQEAFESLVKENMDDLGMDPSDALDDAVHTLTLQGVDLTGIVTCIPGVTSTKDDRVIQSIDGLKSLAAKMSVSKVGREEFATADLEEMAELLSRLYAACSSDEFANAAIATRNGGVELISSICGDLLLDHDKLIVIALKTLACLFHDIQTAETFKLSNGPKIVVEVLHKHIQSINVLENAFSVVAAAATGNEILKESFVDLHIDEIFHQILSQNKFFDIQNLYEALRVLLTPDDGRVLASQVFGYARKFAEAGIAEDLVDALHEGITLPSLVVASTALKSLTVNDEICKTIADHGGIDVILQCIDDSGRQCNKVGAKACCSLLSKLAGSDANKSMIVHKNGLDKLLALASKFSEEPSVLQEIMATISVLSLRSPQTAALAMEAGAGDVVIQAMQKFPAAPQLQRQSCFMIRNLVVRNPENRSILLGNGIEKIIRKAKESHGSCKDAAIAALRDLGLDNYNC